VFTFPPWVYSSIYVISSLAYNSLLRRSLLDILNDRVHWLFTSHQWLKCNGTQGNAVPPPPIYGSKRSPTSDCYNARKRHKTIFRGSNLNVAFPHLKFCTLTTASHHGINSALLWRGLEFNEMPRGIHRIFPQKTMVPSDYCYWDMRMQFSTVYLCA